MSYVTNKVTTHSTLLTSEGKLGVSELIEFFDNKTYSSSDSPKNGKSLISAYAITPKMVR